MQMFLVMGLQNHEAVSRKSEKKQNDIFRDVYLPLFK